MTSGVENQCIDPSLLVSDEESYYASIESSPDQTSSSQTYAPTHIRTYAQQSPAYSGAQCTPDTYVDASDFIPIRFQRDHNSPSASSVALRASGNSAQLALGPSAQVSLLAPLSLRGGGGELQPERVETSPVAALGAWCFLCGCAPVNPGANPNGDGGFDFNPDDGKNGPYCKARCKGDCAEHQSIYLFTSSNHETLLFSIIKRPVHPHSDPS